MAIIVDKTQKRKDIALACKFLFVKEGFKNLTISAIAQEAGIGKGTLYEYFKNKEDIVFEIVNILLMEHNLKKEQKISEAPSTKEKIKVFFDFFYNEETELRELYKEFIAISLNEPNSEMTEFHVQCYNTYGNWLKKILQEGVEKGEIIEQSIGLCNGLFAFGKGMFISSQVTNSSNTLRDALEHHIDILFDLIEVKK